MHSGRDLYLSRHTYSVLSYVISGSRFLSLVANPGKDVFNMKQKSNFMTAKEWLNQARFMTWGIAPQPARAKPYVLSELNPMYSQTQEVCPTPGRGMQLLLALLQVRPAARRGHAHTRWY